MELIVPTDLQLFIAEVIGTFILILLGGGVVANVVLNKTKGFNSGWIVITFGWAMAVFAAVSIAQGAGGLGHLNPAVSIAMSVIADIPIMTVLYLILGQFLGAMFASAILYVAYKQHFDVTEDKDLKLAVFATAPAIRNTGWNMATEIIGTFVLVLGAVLLGKSNASLGALPVGLLVLGIGLSLGGPTGYAINPARDLGPRIMHAILPIKDKGSSDWAYAWVPVAGPVIGGMLAALILKLL